jgi:hypothetical protein
LTALPLLPIPLNDIKSMLAMYCVSILAIVRIVLTAGCLYLAQRHQLPKREMQSGDGEQCETVDAWDLKPISTQVQEDAILDLTKINQLMVRSRASPKIYARYVVPCSHVI